MQRDEIIKTVQDSIEKILPPVIERVVNGKVAKVQETLEEHMELSQAHWALTRQFMEELKPARDGIMTVQTLNRFFKWLGLPALGAAIVYWVFK